MNKIEYKLQKNSFAKGVVNYIGRVKNRKTLLQDDIVDEIVKRGSTLTRTDVKAVLDILAVVIAEMLSAGFTIVTPFANFKTVLKKTFTSLQDVFDKNRHNFETKVVPGLLVKKRAYVGTVPVKLAGTGVIAKLSEFVDTVSGLTNESIVANETGTLRGAGMKFDPADETQGLFLVDDTGNEIAVPNYPRLSTTEIILKVPALEEGKVYKLVLKSRASANDELVPVALPATLKAA